MKKILTIILIVFLFGLGPIGLLNVIDAQVSLKYEVSEPRMMNVVKDESALSIKENHLRMRVNIYMTLAVLGPALGIALILIKAKLPKKN